MGTLVCEEVGCAPKVAKTANVPDAVGMKFARIKDVRTYGPEQEMVFAQNVGTYRSCKLLSPLCLSEGALRATARGQPPPT